MRVAKLWRSLTQRKQVERISRRNSVRTKLCWKIAAFRGG
jgi:hypothetical protein